MQRKSFTRMVCPIARSLERVGEWWSILILRDALHGLTRFDQFQKSLGIAPNMLARRLDALVDAGLLQRRQYSERPPRRRIRADCARARFSPVLVALLAWGTSIRPEGPSVLLVNAKTGAAVDPDPGRSRDRAADPGAGLRIRPGSRRRWSAPDENTQIRWLRRRSTPSSRQAMDAAGASAVRNLPCADSGGTSGHPPLERDDFSSNRIRSSLVGA